MTEEIDKIICDYCEDLDFLEMKDIQQILNAVRLGIAKRPNSTFLFPIRNCPTRTLKIEFENGILQTISVLLKAKDGKTLEMGAKLKR